MTRAEERASQLLRELAIEAPPVPVDAIADQIGATISREPFRGGISGMLYRTEGRAVIGVNSAEPHTRQRFTIAHEIGHFLLHEGRPLIIDRHVRIDRRDHSSSMGTKREEIEANAFAAELLMPDTMVHTHVQALMRNDDSLPADRLVNRLAREFDVSAQAMEIRLGTLGYLSPLIVASG
jgi:Zn-dependent peptidase ImmA (M78 family)